MVLKKREARASGTAGWTQGAGIGSKTQPAGACGSAEVAGPDPPFRSVTPGSEGPGRNPSPAGSSEEARKDTFQRVASVS